MKKISTIYIALMALFFPVIVLAQTKDLDYVIGIVVRYLKIGIALIMVLAVVMFVWNVFKYFIKSDDVEEKKNAGLYVMWSVIGFFVILSMWGLVNIVVNTFKLDDTKPSGIFGTFISTSSSKPDIYSNPVGIMGGKDAAKTAEPGSSATTGIPNQNSYGTGVKNLRGEPMPDL